MSEEIKKDQDYLHFLESLDKVNHAIQGTNDLQQMMRDVLDAVMSIFDCDRAFLLYPCDPEASSWSSPMERSRAEYPGVLSLGLEMPMDAEVSETLLVLLNSNGAVDFGPESEHALPTKVAEQFSIKSYIGMAIYPKVGKPWEFGIHQCSYARVWTRSEKQLFGIIGQRIADGLSVLLSYKELSENRKFFDDIFENVPVMIFVKDAKELHFIRLNKAAEQLLGFSQQELLGKNDYDFFPKEEADYFTAKDREVLDRKELVDIPEETIHTKYGEKILHTKKIPLYDKTGIPAYLLGISEDITERKQMYEALESSEERLLLAAEAAQMGLWDWNIITGDVMWSDQCKAHYGFSPETSMSYELFLQALHPEDREHVDAALNRAVEERTSYNVTKRTIWPDGSIHWTNSRGQVHCDTTGKPVRMIGVTFDITERKQIEEALRESETHLRTLIRTIPDLVWLKDQQGIYLSCNSRFESLYGAKEKDIIGKTDYDFVDKELADFFRKHDKEAIAKGRPSKNEEELTFADDGHREILETIKTPMYRSDGQLAGVLGIGRDITERKRAEEERVAFETELQQAHKMESIGTLAGGVAHEINNPINGIMNYAQLIEDMIDDGSPIKEYAVEIIHETKRVATIVSNLLAFARDEKVSHSPARIKDIVDGTMSLIQAVLRRDQISLEVDVSVDLPKIKCRSQQIQQVIMNLVTNARDALNEKYPDYDENKKIIVSSNLFKKERKDWIRITVKDHGTGIDADIKERMFDPFFTTKSREVGTGLGLSISYGIVKNHHGKLTFESEPGQYTKVHMDLPVDNGWDLDKNARS